MFASFRFGGLRLSAKDFYKEVWDGLKGTQHVSLLEDRCMAERCIVGLFLGRRQESSLETGPPQTRRHASFRAAMGLLLTGGTVSPK